MRNSKRPDLRSLENHKFKSRRSFKSSQAIRMLQQHDQFLDDDNNMRKYADVNLDQQI